MQDSIGYMRAKNKKIYLKIYFDLKRRTFRGP